MAKHQAEVKKSLQLLALQEVDTMNKKQHCSLLTLIEIYSKECPLRPMDVFNLNYSTELYACGLCLTYVIVLLQFKVAELSSFQAGKHV